MQHVKGYWWILFGGMLLAINAGFINATILLSFVQHSVSHLTGNVTMLGASIYQGKTEEIFTLIGILASFLIGAIINGIMLDNQSFSLKHQYGRALILQSILMCFGIMMLERENTLWYLVSGEFLIAMACGMQNSMTTTYSGAVIRTTHLTGTITDLGTELGRLIKGAPYQLWKIKVLSLLALSFFAGALIGAYFTVTTPDDPFDGLWISVVITAIVGISFSIWSYRKKEALKRDAQR